MEPIPTQQPSQHKQEVSVLSSEVMSSNCGYNAVTTLIYGPSLRGKLIATVEEIKY